MKLTVLTTNLIIAGSLSAFAQQKDTLYFNIDGRDTTAAHASYYRVRIRQGAGWQVTDYSPNRKPQITGAFSDDSCKVRQGKWIGYYHTGQVKTGRSKNSSANPTIPAELHNGSAF